MKEYFDNGFVVKMHFVGFWVLTTVLSDVLLCLIHQCLLHSTAHYYYSLQCCAVNTAHYACLQCSAVVTAQYCNQV